ncbi:MAG: MFS transporter, partial [Chloroflexota bacterium]
MNEGLTAVYQRPAKHRWWIMSAILMGTWVGAAGNSMMPVALPAIVSQYNIGLNFGVWIISVYTLFVAVFMPIFGWLGDHFGYRQIYLGGLLGMVFFSAASAFASTFSWLILFRTMQGICAATFLPAVMAIISQVFPPQERGVALGFWAAINGAGHGLGPIISGTLIQTYSWPAVFFFLSGNACLALMAVFYTAPKTATNQAKKFDLLGAATLTVAILSLMFNLSLEPMIIWVQFMVWALFLICIIVFLITERRVATPFVDLALFQNWRYSILTAVASVQFFCLMGVPILAALYLIEIRELNAGFAGLLIAALAVAS